MMAGLRVKAVIDRKVKRIRERKRKSMILLQCIIRARGVRRRLVARRTRTTQIQKWFRQVVMWHRYRTMRNGFVCIQKYFRGGKGRVVADRRKVSRSEAERSEANHTNSIYAQAAGLTIRNATRVWALRIRLFYFAMASKTQRCYRGYCARKRFRQMVVAKKGENAATTIQKFLFYGTIARHSYRATKFIAVKVSAVFKGNRLRASIRGQNNAALTITKSWRRISDRKAFKRVRGSTVLIQTLIRTTLGIMLLQVSERSKLLILNPLLTHS